MLLHGWVEVDREIILPLPVTGDIVRCGQVHMSIFQLGEHLPHELKKCVVAHIFGDARTIIHVDRIPVDMLVFEETIIPVENGPQCIKIASRMITKLHVSHLTALHQKK